MIVATLFFAASLAPSLVPRGALIQGVLSGFSIAAGYGIGLGLAAIWRFFQLPKVTFRFLPHLVGAGCIAVAAFTLTRANGWQNDLRALVDMPPVETLRPISVVLLTAAVFLLILWLSRGVRLTARSFRNWLGRFLPGPQAATIGIVLTALLAWNLANGVLVRGAISVLDATYALSLIHI